MPQIAMTNDERSDALRRFGYTEKEARFLCLAGLHGGYFLRRQFAEFIGNSSGGTPASLIEKLLAATQDPDRAVNLAFFAGGRFHFNDKVSLTLQLGFPPPPRSACRSSANVSASRTTFPCRRPWTSRSPSRCRSRTCLRR